MSKAARDELERRLKDEGKDNPLEYLLSVMHDKTCLKMYRIEAAKSLLPYVHKKQPVAIDLEGEIDVILPYVPGRDELRRADPDFNQDLEDDGSDLEL